MDKYALINELAYIGKLKAHLQLYDYRKKIIFLLSNIIKLKETMSLKEVMKSLQGIVLYPELFRILPGLKALMKCSKRSKHKKSN